MRAKRRSLSQGPAIVASLIIIVVLCNQLVAALVQENDASRWQPVSLEGKGISFRVASNWKHDEGDSVHTEEAFTLEAIDWSTPDKDLIRIYITTIKGGFRSNSGKPATKEDVLEEEFLAAKRDEKQKSETTRYSEARKLSITGVEGVFRRIHVDFQDTTIGVRDGIIWRGFRIYKGKNQEIEININSNPQAQERLNNIFKTFVLERD
jgi:hypothetical protein